MPPGRGSNSSNFAVMPLGARQDETASRSKKVRKMARCDAMIVRDAVWVCESLIDRALERGDHNLQACGMRLRCGSGNREAHQIGRSRSHRSVVNRGSSTALSRARETGPAADGCCGLRKPLAVCNAAHVQTDPHCHSASPPSPAPSSTLMAMSRTRDLDLGLQDTWGEDTPAVWKA